MVIGNIMVPCVWDCCFWEGWGVQARVTFPALPLVRSCVSRRVGGVGLMGMGSGISCDHSLPSDVEGSGDIGVAVALAIFVASRGGAVVGVTIGW